MPRYGRHREGELGFCATAYSAATPLRYLACPQCSARMLLKSIEPAKLGHDRRTFECVNCFYQEFVVTEFEDSFQRTD
jgi:hypothetical protein